MRNIFFWKSHRRAPETALYALRGSLLPANGTNATPFPSDVYNNSTRARKRLADVSLYGRSMVEMLGVLAIIGVLSVGAIAGYQKAMYKYKLNLLTSGINQLLLELSEIFGNDKSKINTFTDSVYVLKSLNVLPQGFSYNNSYSLIAPFNINLGIRLDLGTKEINRNYVTFLITVGSQKLCQDFLAQNWYNDNSYYIAVKPFDDSEIEADDNIVYYRWKNINHLNNLPEINAICAKYCASNQCSIALEQYLNVPN